MKSAKIPVALLASAFVVPWLVRGGLALASDALRYDRLRRMSGDGSFAQQLPKLVGAIAAAERCAFAEILPMLAGLPAGALRYARIKAM